MVLKITIELIPHGEAEERKTIAEATITNDGTGDLAIGNYDCEVFGLLDKKKGRKTRVEGFFRPNNVWYLVREMIDGVMR